MRKYLCLLALSLFLVSCAEEVSPKIVCSSDADCVAAECCHATSAVNKANAPDCSTIYCTMDCAPNTLDCGQGQIKCVDNMCTVRLNE